MIGRYLTLEECTKSDYAIRKQIDNTPPAEIISVMNQAAINIYDKLVDHFGHRIPISSFYRSPKVNKGIGGSATSSHCKGEAMDLDMDGSGLALTNQVLFMWIMQNLEFDQLISEYPTNGNPSWVHVGYRKGNNRKQVLVATKVNGKTIYSTYQAL
jgi:zinc D-Ala-D-Ala carboxypeptidase